MFNFINKHFKNIVLVILAVFLAFSLFYNFRFAKEIDETLQLCEKYADLVQRQQDIIEIMEEKENVSNNMSV